MAVGVSVGAPMGGADGLDGVSRACTLRFYVCRGCGLGFWWGFGFYRGVDCVW